MKFMIVPTSADVAGRMEISLSVSGESPSAKIAHLQITFAAAALRTTAASFPGAPFGVPTMTDVPSRDERLDPGPSRSFILSLRGDPFRVADASVQRDAAL